MSFRYWTGTSLQLRLMRGVFLNDINLLMILPRMSLHSKLVAVQYRGYEYGQIPMSITQTQTHGGGALSKPHLDNFDQLPHVNEVEVRLKS